MTTKERVKTAIFIVLWLSFFGVIVGTSPSFQTCVGEHYQREASNSLQNGPAYFIVMSEGFAPCLGEFVHKNAEAIIALFTIILGIATWLLWRATDKLVRGAEDTAKRQLRAYLVASGAAIERIPEGFRLTVALKNTGQTPAFDVRVMSESFGGKYPLEAGRDQAPPRNDYSSVIGSGDEFHCLRRIFADSPDETVENIRSGEMGLWIQGWATYEDCFGKSHHTKFRRVFGGPLASGGDLLLYADREGNSAD